MALTQPSTINNSILFEGHYADDVMTPIETFADLVTFPTTKIFSGLNIVVENYDELTKLHLPVKFQYRSKTARNRFNWVITELPVFPTFADLSATTNNIVTTLGSKSKAFYVGLESTVQVDETTGDIEKYVVTEVTNGLPTWELKTSSIPVIGDDIKK